MRDVVPERGHDVVDLGAFDPSQPDDYADYAIAVTTPAIGTRLTCAQ